MFYKYNNIKIKISQQISIFFHKIQNFLDNKNVVILIFLLYIVYLLVHTYEKKIDYVVNFFHSISKFDKISEIFSLLINSTHPSLTKIIRTSFSFIE